MATTDIASYPFFFTEEGRALAKSAAEQIVHSATGESLSADQRSLVDMLNTMAEGQPVIGVPLQDELTVSQTADILGFSEQHVDDLLDAGRIEFHITEGDRMIQRSSLLDYSMRLRHANTAVDEMVRLSEEMGLYDD